MACDEVYKTAFTYENLNLLEASIVKGVRRVKYSDKEIEYRTIAEMIAILKLMKRSLKPKRCGGGLFGGRRIIARHSKGLDDSGSSASETNFDMYKTDEEC